MCGRMVVHIGQNIMTTKKTFLWGVVNIAQQTEGYDTTSDWAPWARRAWGPPIGVANDYYHRYAQDHALAQSLGCTAMRVSIAWSRVEPADGYFDAAAIAHYRAMLMDIRSRGMQTVVGLWHWSVPAWCARRYPPHTAAFTERCMQFVQRMCESCGDLIDVVVPLNELNVFISAGYVSGERPPFLQSRVRAALAAHRLLAVHRQTYVLWKKTYPAAVVGSTFLWNDEQPAHGTLVQKVVLRIKRAITTTWMLRAVAPTSDFLGINYYTSDTFYIGRSGGRWGMHGTNDWHSPDVWQSFPKGLYRVLMEVRRFGKPIMILENGKPTHDVIDDRDRQAMLAQTLTWMRKAIADGADVRGYFHYSLCDSYEWTGGYDAKFGLCGVNRTTGMRTVRGSARLYKTLIARYGTVFSQHHHTS